MSATEAERHPILFSAPLVRAILRGEKTQTRRVVNPQPDRGWEPAHYCTGAPRHGWINYRRDGRGTWQTKGERYDCPYGKPGDELLVREAFRLPKAWDEASPSEYVEWKGLEWRTEADDMIHTPGGSSKNPLDKDAWGRLRPSIHMPYDLCRIRLRVEDVRVERLQEITHQGILSEGVQPAEVKSVGTLERAEQATRDKWIRLWNRINADRGFPWEDDPYVWVVEFSRITD